MWILPKANYGSPVLMVIIFLYIKEFTIWKSQKKEQNIGSSVSFMEPNIKGFLPDRFKPLQNKAFILPDL